MKLSIVIPCYNESKNIPLVLDAFSQAIKRNDIELIVVNNGSTDDSQQVLDCLLSKYPFVRVVKVGVNKGYGFGIISGLSSSIGDYVAWTHADMQTDPADVIKALELIEKSPRPEKTFVKGTRKGRPFRETFFTLGMSFFESIYLGAQLNDINAQPNLFHRSFLKMLSKPPLDFSFDLYVFYMARKYNLKVIRFPVFFGIRIYGQSHWNSDWKSYYKFIKRTLDYSKKLKNCLNLEQKQNYKS